MNRVVEVREITENKEHHRRRVTGYRICEFESSLRVAGVTGKLTVDDELLSFESCTHLHLFTHGRESLVAMRVVYEVVILLRPLRKLQQRIEHFATF